MNSLNNTSTATLTNSDDVLNKYKQLYEDAGLGKTYRYMIWDQTFKNLGVNPSVEKINSVWEHIKQNIMSEEVMSYYGEPITVWRKPLISVFSKLVSELWPDRALDYNTLKKEVDFRSERLSVQASRKYN